MWTNRRGKLECSSATRANGNRASRQILSAAACEPDKHDDAEDGDDWRDAEASEDDGDGGAGGVHEGMGLGGEEELKAD